MKKLYSSKSVDRLPLSHGKPLFAGGGGGASYPTIIKDNLISEDYMEVLLGIGEGVIEGLEDGEKSLYLDTTPLMSANGTKNFQDYELVTTQGDPTQDETITLKLGAESPVDVGSALGSLTGYDAEDERDSPDYDDINNPRARFVEITQFRDYDYIDIRLQVSSLYTSSADGDQTNGSFTFQVKWQTIGASFWTTLDLQTITGKTTTGYIRDYRLWLPEDVKNNVRLRVICTNDKPQTYGNQFMVSWAGVSVGVSKNNYEFKNTACTKLFIKASDRLSSQPQIWGVYKLLKIKVPSNYDPETHTYDGLWDGTFKIAWSNNPAWCLYDLITNDRYGLRSFYTFDVNKYDFYDAGLFCDEPVPVGDRGETEPRYTFNALIDQKKNAREICSEIAGAFGATMFEDASGEVRLRVPRDDDPVVHVFSKENVLNGYFSYTFTSPSEWVNSINVTFCNSEQDWIQDTLTVEDEESILRYGKNEVDSNLYGCIKESEAARRAYLAILSAKTEKTTVSFTTARAGLNLDLLDVILVSDESMGYSQSGRIKSVSDDRKKVYLRSPVFLESAVIGEELMYFADFQVGASVLSYQLKVVGVGEVYELEFEDELDENIERYSLFTLRTNVPTLRGNPKPFRVISIKEDKGNPDNIQISALELNRTKQYDADHKQFSREGKYSYYDVPTNIPHIIDLTFDEYFDRKEKTVFLNLNPVVDDTAYKWYNGRYKVYWRYYGNTAWNEIDTIYVTTVKDPPTGQIEWAVLPYNTLGQLPDLETAPVFRYDTYDLAEPPENVKNLQATEGLTTARLTWDAVLDPDIMCYEVREGENWESGKILTFSTTNPEYVYTFKDLERHRLMVKAKDAIGTYSEIPAVIYVEAGYPEPVKEFYVTPNNDNIRFDWVSTGDANVEYEVRTGNSTWGSGITLFKTKSLNQTILNPSFDYTGYLIKSVSSLGRYSQSATFTEYKMALKQDRNIIFTCDNTQAFPASGRLVFAKNPVAGENIKVNSATYVFGTDVEIGGTLPETLRNVAKIINQDVMFQSNGINTLTLIANTAGKEGNLISYSTTCNGAVADGTLLTGGMDKWGGITQGFVRTNNDQALEMDDGAYFAEHYFPVHLASKTRARNWFETETFKYDSSLVFADLDFSWNSEEAKNTTWLNSSGVGASEGQGVPVIAWSEPEKYMYDLGIPLDGQLQDVKGNLSPSSSYEVSYGDNRCAEALVLNRIVDLRYDVNVPREFSFRFTLKTTKRTINYYEILRLKGDGCYVDVTKEEENIVARWSDGITQIVPFVRFSDYDYVFVQLTQATSLRTLSVATEKAGHFEEVETQAEPLGLFSELIVGSRY